MVVGGVFFGEVQEGGSRPAVVVLVAVVERSPFRRVVAAVVGMTVARVLVVAVVAGGRLTFALFGGRRLV